MAWRTIGSTGILAFVLACAGSEDTTPQGGTGGTTTGGTGGTGLTGTGTGTGTAAAGGSGGTASGTGGTTTGGGGGVVCTPVTLGALQLTDTEDGGSSLAFAIEGLASGHEHILFLEFFDHAGAQTAGSFDVSQPPDDNYSTCAHCVLAYENFDLGSPTEYYPDSGTIDVSEPDVSFTGESSGTLTSMRLIEVEVNSTVTTPVPGGGCLSIVSSPWDTTP
jgi:hypothetical protein